MKIHHLSCGTMCPLGGHLMDGITPGFGPSTLVCHCLLLEMPEGLTLVDTGFGSADLLNDQSRISPFFRVMNRPSTNVEESALHQIIKLGFKQEDVRNIVVTHLDFDHAGGISDFPNARVHVFNTEYEQALQKGGFINSRRYCQTQWKQHQNWNRYQAVGEKWFGFDAVRNLEGLNSDVLLIPLVGHTWGHCGVAVDNGSEWMLLAGDAYFNTAEMDPLKPDCPAGAAAYQTLMEVDRKNRLWNQLRLRELIRSAGDRIKVSCSHDPSELRAFQQNSWPHAHERLSRPRPHGKPEFNPGLS